jgi:HD-like signal output (HDOD) protein
MTEVRAAHNLPRTLPPLPEVVVELISMLGTDAIHGGEIARLVARDPALASAMLKLANSSFFGLTGRISNIQDAITLIGVKAVSNMLLVLGVRNALRPESRVFDTYGFWMHALGTAVAARALTRSHPVSRDQAFLAGLLHDLGKLSIACVEPDALMRIAERMRTEACDWTDAEIALGLPGHEAAGAALGTSWQLPDELVAVMSRHHNPVPDDCLLVHIVHLANMLVHMAHCLDTPDEVAPRLAAHSWQRISPTEEDIENALLAVRKLSSRASEWRAVLAAS